MLRNHSAARDFLPIARALRPCLALLALAGCTSPRQWIANGLKVGPQYRPPVAAIETDWIDADDRRVLRDPVERTPWWSTFQDPVLSALVAEAYRQNLPLREAAVRIWQARALRAIAIGNVLPQQQQASGSYSYSLVPGTGPGRTFTTWNGALSLAWELDFWGRYRRAVEAADADLNASVENYGDVLITLVADVATTYVDIRTLQRRLELTHLNVDRQRSTFNLAQTRFNEGLASEIDVYQAESNLAQTEAFVPQLETALRQSQNQLCVLLGIPPRDLSRRLGEGPIPTASPEVAVGIPANLLLRRPDVRRAERQLAAQSARIGVAVADLYPHITLSGTIGVTANEFQDLFGGDAAFGSLGPSVRWNILNYGRIANNVRFQDARFRELLLAYWQTVLAANADVENALVFFLRSQTRLQSQNEAANAARQSNELVMNLYREGLVDFNRVFNVQNFATQQELAAAQAQGDVARGLIAVYRALGGGWQAYLAGRQPFAPPAAAETLPPPPPEEGEELPAAT